MKDEQLAKLISESMLHTSADFTEKLMARAELKRANRKRFRLVCFTAFVLCGLLLLVITKAPSDLNLLKRTIHLPLTLMKVVGALFVFTIWNKLIRINAELKRT